MESDKAENEIIAVNVENGLVIQKYLLDVPLQGDWESMALGPCTCSGIKSCLYIGNMGDNLASDWDKKNCTTRRTLVNIYNAKQKKKSLSILSPVAWYVRVVNKRQEGRCYCKL